jgi:hypothetical protein
MQIRSLLRTGFAAAFLATSMGAATSAFTTQDNQQPRQGNDLSGLHAFDSRVGCWTFHNRVLRESAWPIATIGSNTTANSVSGW